MIRRIIRVIKRDGVSLFLIRVLAKILRVDIGYQASKNKAWQILEAKYGNEYWLGLHNFYVISRYNPRTKYAMAVYQLSELIQDGRCAQTDC